MKMIVADLEGVFLPEIWINVALKTGIEELKLTTRDISDYDVLMTKRLSILKENNLKIQDIQDVISTLDPLDGAAQMLNWIREESQIIILSDTFEEFAKPLMEKLNFPALFCHNLTIDAKGNITDYRAVSCPSISSEGSASANPNAWASFEASSNSEPSLDILVRI